ncbi:site-specific integrase [Limnoglobus roseus]|uniref:hypothetical protein n=1 Tax=Limnoglobus roseus TaxID=2598579 RepID=UPI0011EAC9B4|nr:hypothetical protein [Limnoglobus roseus]
MVAGLIRFQQLTGCRPGEACLLRMCDIDRSGPVWVYTPHHHKLAHRGKSRTIAVGPKAQLLVPSFERVDGYLFSPPASIKAYHASRTAARKTPKCASHMARNAAKRKSRKNREPWDHYDPNASCRRGPGRRRGLPTARPSSEAYAATSGSRSAVARRLRRES